jgi:hypothetical protein
MTAVNYPGKRRGGPQTGEIFMRALISALAVAGLVAIALPGYADDVKADPAKSAAKPGRSIDEGSAVKTDPANLSKPGRAADDSVKTDKAPGIKPGRAADDSVKTDKAPGTKPGRAADDSVKTDKAPGTKPGRAADDSTKSSTSKKKSTKKKTTQQPAPTN